MAKQAEIGTKHGRWTVIGGTWRRPICQCDCGTQRVTTGYDIRAGKSVSCGCFNREATGARSRVQNRRHGYADTPTMTSWTEMKRRCYAAHRKEYANYGGRGIVVCDRWLESFANFLADMGPRPAGHTLDREDNDGPYSPDNCRWLAREAQERNKRSNAVYDFGDGPMTVAEAAGRYGVKPMTLYNRLRTLGWTPHRAVIEPVNRK